MNPYNYLRCEPCFNLQLYRTTENWLHYTVDFPNASLTYSPKNGIPELCSAHGEYLLPRNNHKAPLAILIHGWGDRSVIPCKILARPLLKKGIACFILYLVFHSSRLSETLKAKGHHLSQEEWFHGYQISVTNVRQIVDWASTRDEINGKQIAVIGISLGGFVSSISMGVDDRINAGVFLVSSGNGAKVAWLTRHRFFRNSYLYTEEEYKEIQRQYQQYLVEVADKGFENVNPPMESFLTDSMTFAYRLRQRPVLMINALWDEFIPRETALEFWEACGKPDISWFPAMHTTIWLYHPLIHRRITSFLESTFNHQESTPLKPNEASPS